MRHPLQAAFVALTLAAIGQAFWQHARLPARVAAHFNASGRADGWMSREMNTACHVATILFLATIFQGLALLPRRLPKEMINLPHRDHWLAPERAADTHAWISALVLSLGCAVMGFFLSLFHLTYRANLASPPHLHGPIWWLTGALLLAVGAGVVLMLHRFRRLPAS